MIVEDRDTFNAAFNNARAVIQSFPDARAMCDEAKIDGFTHVARGIGSWEPMIGAALVLVFYRSDGLMRTWFRLRTRVRDGHQLNNELMFRGEYLSTEEDRWKYYVFCVNNRLELAPRERLDEVLSAEPPRAQAN